jgi:uncharacterized protein YecE (DUF72 family)
MKWHIGCSGFHYKHWKGLFYSADMPQRLWFEHYSSFFDSLELNVTFYRFPELSFLKNWYDKSPAKFRFAVKAPKAITHFKKFNGTADMLADFYSTIREGLGKKLGCVLFQMPPRMSYSEEMLERIIQSLDPSFLNVLEFRNVSWWRQEVYDKLSGHNITFCGMSHPDLPKDIICNTKLLYYRFHGEEQLYASNYSDLSLQKVIDTISDCKKVKEAYIFFNNDIFGYAVDNAQQMKKMALKSR